MTTATTSKANPDAAAFVPVAKINCEQADAFGLLDPPGVRIADPPTEMAYPTLIMLSDPGKANRYLVGLWDGSRITCAGKDDHGSDVMHTGKPHEVAKAAGVKVWNIRPGGAYRRLRAWQRELLQARYPEASIMRGRDFSGAGARFGWWAKMPSGDARYLGQTLDDAVRQ